MTSVVLAACGSHTVSAKDLRACIDKHLPRGAVDRVFASEEEGVTTVNYYRHGNETDVSIFKSVADAKEAEKAEARIGDAHDRRIKNVLYSGGGIVERALIGCLK